MQHEQRNCRQNWRILQSIASALGFNWNYKTTEDVFDEITHVVPGFKGMTYELLDEFDGLTLEKANKPDPKTYKYSSHSYKPG
jgi:formate dehydrogenase (hydrogenase)